MSNTFVTEQKKTVSVPASDPPPGPMFNIFYKEGQSLDNCLIANSARRVSQLPFVFTSFIFFYLFPTLSFVFFPLSLSHQTIRSNFSFLFFSSSYYTLFSFQAELRKSKKEQQQLQQSQSQSKGGETEAKRSGLKGSMKSDREAALTNNTCQANGSSGSSSNSRSSGSSGRGNEDSCSSGMTAGSSSAGSSRRNSFSKTL